MFKINYIKSLFILFGIAFVILGILFYPLTIGKNTLFESIKTGYNNSTESLDNKAPLASYQNGYNFEKYYSEIYNGYEFVITEFNPFSPVITLVSKDRDSTVSVNILVLKRNINNSFEFQTQRGGYMRNKTFDEALALAKRYDLSKYNPDPTNIIINPAPTREQVEKNKQLNDKNNQLRDNPEFIKAYRECGDKYSGDEQLTCINEQQLKFYKP